jgi:UDP-arabinose 4-epimerase
MAVMHFAAFSTVAESVRDPAACYRTNVLGSATLLETMREQGVRHLVFSSTAAVYGVPAHCPVAEDSRLDPINPYGRSKLAVERMIADYGAAYGLNWMALRYFNAAGADPEGETGELHDPETHLIPRALMAAGGQLPELEVFGDDYDTADGSCLRDYVHVSDLAEAHLAALAHLMAGGASQALNLGTGRGQTSFKVIRTVERVTGRAVPLRVGQRRPGDPPVLVADAGRAAAVLGCKFRFTELEQIVATAWEWHRRRE